MKHYILLPLSDWAPLIQIPTYFSPSTISQPLVINNEPNLWILSHMTSAGPFSSALRAHLEACPGHCYIELQFANVYLQGIN